ncbi:MAG: L,D-transpeptidase [Proteobacteria bacterium]|nr:L,D-transpeptidase [Pseudomonadota bacterium]
MNHISHYFMTIITQQIAPKTRCALITFLVTISTLLSLLSTSCSHDSPPGLVPNFKTFWHDRVPSSTTSDLHYYITDELDKTVIIEQIVESPMVIIVNLATNRSTIIKDRIVIDSWNSATSDLSGEWHVRNGVSIPQMTPPGIYTLHEMDHCPPWLPSDPVGFEKTNDDEQDYLNRMKIFEENHDLYGPCGYHNPLGHYALWFYDAYGFHGTTIDLEYILSLPTEARRVSGGCIRNPINKIEKLFHLILQQTSNYSGFQQSIRNNIAAAEKKTLVKNIADTYDVRFVIGHFKGDLPFVRTPAGIQTVKLKSKLICEIQHDNVPIYSSHRFNDNSLIGYYNKGDIIEPLNELIPETRNPVHTQNGWISQYYTEGYCSSYDHYWEKTIIARSL